MDASDISYPMSVGQSNNLNSFSHVSYLVIP